MDKRVGGTCTQFGPICKPLGPDAEHIFAHYAKLSMCSPTLLPKHSQKKLALKRLYFNFCIFEQTTMDKGQNTKWS